MTFLFQIIYVFSGFRTFALVLFIDFPTVCVYIQGVPGGKDLTSGECSLGQTITI